ncbi:PASTA domain-containing protein [Weeksellaceae bacterium TAE3-ERU29]|nr:PASTA domain-containing protein [Weeksellaceae bacterium TAE3-ERU29]
MDFFKALFSWKLWLNILIGAIIIVGLWFFSFNWLNSFTNHNVEVKVPDLSKMNIQQAMAELENLGLEYSVDSVRFSEDYKPYAVLDYYPIAGSAVKPGRKIFIKSNPRTWQPVELPNLIDKSKRLAFTQLTMRHFVVGDTIYVKDPAKDAVLKVLYNGQEVAAGTLLPRGSRVDLVLGKGFDLDVSVPNLVGLTLDEARATIAENFFELGNINFLGASKDTLSATVVYQDPPFGDIYDQGLPISVWLSTDMVSNLSKQIDSLDIVFRRKMKKEDSLYYKSIQKSKNIDISNLPEEIRNQVKNDDAARNNLNKPKNKKQTNKPKIDTTGIIID